MANHYNSVGLTGFAPYNFIPFYTGEVPVRYKKDSDGKEHLPAFNSGNGERLSGYVDYNVRVLTDLAICDNLSGDREAGGVRTFFRDARGTLAIPGSEMRGLVRSAAEILSLTRPEAIADERYMYRKLAGNCKKVRNEYQSYLVGNKTQPNRGAGADSRTMTPEGVEAGILSKRGNRYYIQPVQIIPGTNNTFLKISEKTLRSAQKKGLLHLDPSHFLFKDDACQRVNWNYRPYRGKEIEFSYENRELRFDVEEGTGTRGALLNSAYIGNGARGTYKDGTPYPKGKSHHYLVSTVIDTGRSEIEVDPKDARAYQHDYDRNCIQNKALKDNKEFYGLPQTDAKTKMFFYKLGADGKLLGFGPTPYFRIFYRKSVHDGLPMRYDRSKGLDYVLSMFGYIAGTDDTDAGYKSRLSFQNAEIHEYTKDDLVIRDLALMGPKGSAFDMYLEQVGRHLKGEDNDGLSDYNDDEFRLRGNKIYWKRSGALTPKWEGTNDAVLSHVEVLKAGKDQQKYITGRVYFDNLYEDELGLLLMSLQYKDAQDDSTRETRLLGSGKPYGYGKVEISVSGLRLLDDKDRFMSINPSMTDAMNQVESFKQKYRDAINEELRRDNRTFEEEPSIKVYKAWLENDNVDTYLNQYPGHPYMSVQGADGVPMYGKSEPIEMASDILGINVPRKRITNKVPERSHDGQRRNSRPSGPMIAGTETKVGKRNKKISYYRMIVVNDPKKDAFFRVRPDTGDIDTSRKFGKRSEARCYVDKMDSEFKSDLSKVKPGMVVYARLEEDPTRRNKKMPKLKELNAVDWYTEEA